MTARRKSASSTARPARAAALAKSWAARSRGIAWEERETALAGAALLVNATSLGMAGQPALELPLDRLAARTRW